MPPLRFIGAPTNLGLKPYDDGTPRGLDQAPAVWRRLSLPARLRAADAGDVAAGAYRDFVRPPGGIRNADLVEDHARRLAEAVAVAMSDGSRAVVAGGDCSVLLGSLAGLPAGRYGLVFVDGHSDFGTPAISLTGAVAGMDLALALGRVDHPLSRLRPNGPLVREEDVVVLGRRDWADEALYGEGSIRHTGILDIPFEDVGRMGVDAAVSEALARVTRPGLDGFWIHFDVDVLRSDVIAAVDSPEAGGLSLEEGAAVLRALWTAPGARGVDVTIYDPRLDPDLRQGALLVDLLAAALTPGTPVPG